MSSLFFKKYLLGLPAAKGNWFRELDALIGYVACKYTNGSGLIGIGILKKYTGLGLGSNALRIVIEFAKQHHYDALDLEVANSNASAIRLYTKLGFESISNDRTDTRMLLKL
jgi:ribosomal protein S18 acetylase RimI-like enzyme